MKSPFALNQVSPHQLDRVSSVVEDAEGRLFVRGERVYYINGFPYHRLSKGSKASGSHRGRPVFHGWCFYYDSDRGGDNDPDPGGDHAWDNGGFWGDLCDAEGANY